MMVGAFLALTFAISLLGFACIYLLPFARSPESPAGLPFWLVMVWGPSLAALILATRTGEAWVLLAKAVAYDTVPLVAWGLVLAPLVMLVLLRPFAPEAPQTLGIGMALAMAVLNLVLGPLGEEMGWRGLMQPALQPRFGWLGAAFLVGGIWFLWHLPLWAIDSPHAQISAPLFGVHCLLYAVIIAGAQTLSQGSLLPAILLHLTVNLASNYAAFAGFRDPNSWFVVSLAPYGGLAALTILLVWVLGGEAAEGLL